MRSPVLGMVKSLVLVLSVVVMMVVYTVDAVPSEKQTQEILLLDALGRRSNTHQDHDTFMDMLGRSKIFHMFVDLIYSHITYILHISTKSSCRKERYEFKY